MKTKNIIMSVIIAAFAGGAVFLYMNFASLLVNAAEKIASDALGVRVTIGSIDWSVADKTVTVNKIAIANPPGYRKAKIITAETVAIVLNTASKELIDFKDIQVKGSVVNLEVNERGMNVVDLKNLANRKKQTNNVGSKQVRVIVKHMVIDAATINPSITLIDRDIAPIRMPAISFSNIGQGGGVDAGSALVQIMTKYLTAVQNQARASGMLNGIKVPGLNDVQKTLDDAGGQLKKLFQ